MPYQGRCGCRWQWRQHESGRHPGDRHPGRTSGGSENHLRASGLAFTIIRPGGFSNGQSSGKAKLTEDHLAFSYIARVDVANLAIEALGNDESIGKTFTAYDSDMLHLYRIFMD